MAEVNRTPRLEMLGIRKAFGATVALDGVDLSVPPGEICALIGENGAGKSTLMQVLSGALRPDAGTMHLDGRPYAPPDPYAARIAGVAMIYQELSLAPHLPVEDNIMLGMEPARFGCVRRRQVRASAMEALRQLGHSDIDPRSPVGILPIGMQQVVEIARALAVGCRVLVLDEPTSSLTRDDIGRLFQIVRRLKEQGIGIVYISHFLEEVREVADTFMVLRDGRAAGQGRIAEASVQEMVGMMVGRKVENLYPRSPHRPGEAILDVRDLAGMSKPSSASLELHRGEVLGIAGLVGAGRTELLRSIFGLDPVREGRIRVGEFVGPASPAARLAQGVGMLSENRRREGLATSLTVADNIAMSCLTAMGPAGCVFPSRVNRAASRWIDRLAIRCRGARQRVSELSGGSQQKVAFARLLQHDVDVLLLDEPTRGIDVGSKAQIYRLIDDLARGSGRQPAAILIVSSYLPELLGICDRIAVMYRGRLGPARRVEELNEHQLMLGLMGGEEAA